MSLWMTYLIFFAKAITIVLAILITVSGIFSIIRKNKTPEKERLNVNLLNKKYKDLSLILQSAIVSKKLFKQQQKQDKKQQKKDLKEKDLKDKKRVFVLEFSGDIKAKQVNHLREEITTVLSVATQEDEIFLKLNSPGGMIAPYGLAASQLQRIRDKKIPLTIAVDKIAASGGYLMASVANKIIAAPFAIIGSIGVVAQLPNFHRFLKKHAIDFEQLTAGEYKRTLTLFGENTEKAREKMHADLEEMHQIFKKFLLTHRPQLDIGSVATGAHWLAVDALELKLVDELITSDEYLMQCCQSSDVYEVRYRTKPSLTDRLTGGLQRLKNHLAELGYL
jgi:serine protease SohB